MIARDICNELEELREERADFHEILCRAVQHLHDSDERFHWTGIYELYPDGVLRLGPFVGSPTDHVFIAVGHGVCGTAVAEGRNINVPDVRNQPNYLACSAATRSELVVLIRKDGRIFAQIDIDSHELNAFDEGIEEQVQQVADFLADAFSEREAGAGDPGEAREPRARREPART